MTEQEIIDLVSKYLISHWESIILSASGFLGTLIVSVWFVARHWYQREIKHLEMHKQSADVLSQKECAFLTKQIQDKESYARGVIEVMNQRLAIAEEKPKELLKIIQQQENQLADFQKKYEEQKALIEKSKIKNDLIISDRHSIQNIYNACRISPNDSRFKSFAQDCMEFNFNDDERRNKEVLFLNGFISLQAEKILEIERKLNYIFISYRYSEVDFTKDFLKVLSPFISNSLDFNKKVTNKELEKNIKDLKNKINESTEMETLIKKAKEMFEDNNNA